MKNLIVFLIITILSCSCINKQKNKETEINEKIASTLLLYGRQVEAHSTIDEMKLSLELFFKSPSFIDPETQKMILALLAYHMHDYYVDYDSIYVNYIDEGLLDTIHYQQGIKDVEISYNKFSNNKTFLTQVSYSLNNMSQDEILASSLIIKELNRIMPDVFNFTGSFWLLLYQYSLNYLNENSIEVKNFTVFVNAASLNGSHVNPINLKNILRITHGKPIDPLTTK